MGPEDVVMRYAYVALFMVLALMTWAVSVQAALGRGGGGGGGSPCSFNLLCSCSKPGPMDYGLVFCHSVPFPSLPSTLNSSRAFALSMSQNGMRVLEARQLVGSGLWRLEVIFNGLVRVEEGAFVGLGKSLQELDLSSNQLTEIPTSALRTLTKLGLINLSRNRLLDASFEGWGQTLTHVSLADNFLTSLPDGGTGLGNLPLLQKLDLGGNSISVIHPGAFAGTPSLSHLVLEDNLLRQIPFGGLAPLTKLVTLDLSHNLIADLDPVDLGKTPPTRKLPLSSLNLAHNRITSLPPSGIHNFASLSVLNLTGNRIPLLSDDAFRGLTSLEEIDLSGCSIKEIGPHAFRGLEKSLRNLHLGDNRVTLIPPDLFSSLGRLHHLTLDKNGVGVGVGGVAQESLRALSLLQLQLPRGAKRGHVSKPSSSSPNIHDFLSLPLKNLVELNISSVGLTTLPPNFLGGASLPSLQRLRLSHAKLTTILRSAFAELPGLRTLDLSHNRLSRLDEAAFQGPSGGLGLSSLVLRNAVRVSSLPPTLFHPLGPSLTHLDLSSGSLSSLRPSAFAHSASLAHLNLRSNRLLSLSSALFSPDHLPALTTLSLAFNALREVGTETFFRLKHLRHLELNENEVGVVRGGAFRDLPSLRTLTLAGNRLSVLEEEAFSSLPRLILLDFSHNFLSSLNLGALEGCGTLAEGFRLDASWNRIQNLGEFPPQTNNSINSADVNVTTPAPTPHHHDHHSSSSISSLDLSHNFISSVGRGYLAALTTTLLELDLSFNLFPALPADLLRGLTYLQRLHLHSNHIQRIEPDALRDAGLLQILSLDQNEIQQFPPTLLQGCRSLRVFSVAQNRIRSLPEGFFRDAPIQVLSLQGNQLTRWPEAVLSPIASTLTQLDLSGNELSSLTPEQVGGLASLRSLSLGRNKIVFIGDAAFSSLRRLLELDISGNPMGRLGSRLWAEGDSSLLHLNVAEMGLDVFPQLPSSAGLLSLNVSGNEVTSLPPTFNVGLASLRVLDLGRNAIESVPPPRVWGTLPKLGWLCLGENPVRVLGNESFLGMERVRHLDISHLPLETLEVGFLSPLSSLKSLKFGPLLPPPVHPSVAALLQGLDSLQSLHLLVDDPELTPAAFGTSPLPPKLSHLQISGPDLVSIEDGVLGGIQRRSFHLSLEDTGLAELSPGFFTDTGHAVDLSLEIGEGNPFFRVIGNPVRPSSPHLRLKEITISPLSSISCSCDSGWIEFWLREWMDQTCPIHPNHEYSAEACSSTLSALRRVQCEEGQSGGGEDEWGVDLGVGTRTLLQAFVSDLECGWDTGRAAGRNRIRESSLGIMLLFLFYLKVILNY